MDPITLVIIWAIKSLIIGGAVGGVVGAVIYVAYLTLSTVLQWFSQNNTLSTYNSNLVAATINKGLKNGKYTVVQGVFNKRTNSIVEGRTIETTQLDSTLAQRHRAHDVVLYDYYEY
jgi:hypothetical protein